MICFCPHLSHSRSGREGRYRHQNSCFSHFTLSFCFCHILQMPDVSVILCNRSVGREKSGFGNVHQHFFLPRFFIFVIRKHLLFCSDIIFHIQKCHEPVFAYDFFVQTSQVHRISDADQIFTDNKVYQLFYQRIILIDVFGTVFSCLIQLDDLF